MVQTERRGMKGGPVRKGTWAWWRTGGKFSGGDRGAVVMVEVIEVRPDIHSVTVRTSKPYRDRETGEAGCVFLANPDFLTVAR